ncbi:14891_t:CDS:10 [Funneliformis caledonium]|uniref:14891_t:CDS:1 n=1 Tax=Funneliformis caledonium TaxID=1117310 RepID=A0A9N9FFV9_9GLOM|nr:14891_t:CDS:10 [Funneliformis caledonium]
MEQIPIIDFSLFDQIDCSKEIKRASETIGFFYLKNHGISQDEAKEFFDLSKEEKLKYTVNENYNGYVSVHQEMLDPSNQKIGDWKECFNFGKLHDEKPRSQILPPYFEGKSEFINKFEKKCHQLCMKILQAFAIALEIPPEEGGKNWFEQRHKYENDSGDTLRILHYPPIKHNIDEKDIRAGSHTDYGSLTILFQKDIGGLEVELPSTKQWISAPVINDCVLINIADLLEYWSKGLFKSTKHRVVFNDDTVKKDRYSIAYFCHAENDAGLDPIPSKYLENLVPLNLEKGISYGVDGVKKPSTAGEHLIYFCIEMGGTQSTEAKGYGYHVLRVQENSPAYTVGIEPFFDYIVGINGVQLVIDSSYLQEQLLLNIDKEVILLIYSTKEQEFREVSLIPNRDWSSNSQDGLIGCSIRYCLYESTNENVWHILDVAVDSPAEMAGLVSMTDYVIGTPHATLRNESDFYDLIDVYLGKPLRLYVYNADFDVCREVIIVPNHEWGGEGSLGCGVGYGYLHRIPKTNKFKSHEQEFTLPWDASPQETRIESSVPATTTNLTNYQHYNPENDTITPTLYHVESNNNEQNAEFFTPANLQPKMMNIERVSNESENIITSEKVGINDREIEEAFEEKVILNEKQGKQD